MMAHDVKPIARVQVRERRRSRRWVVTLGLIADIADNVVVRGYLFDLSLSGAYIVLDTNAEIGTRVTLTFRIENTGEEAYAAGHVARFVSLAHRVGVGVAFSDMSRDCRKFIRALDAQNDSERLATFQLVRTLRLKIRPAA